MKKKRLTQKRTTFINEYLQCWNASEATRRAGYSAKTAYSTGSYLLRIPEVSEKIEDFQKKNAMSASEVLARLSAMARGTIAHFFHVTKKGMIEFDFSSQEAQAHMYLIKKIRTKRKRLLESKEKDARTWEHEWIEVELYDAQAALVALGKHHRLFSDRFESQHTLQIEGFQELINKVYGNRNK